MTYVGANKEFTEALTNAVAKRGLRCNQCSDVLTWVNEGTPRNTPAKLVGENSLGSGQFLLAVISVGRARVVFITAGLRNFLGGTFRLSSVRVCGHRRRVCSSSSLGDSLSGKTCSKTENPLGRPGTLTQAIVAGGSRSHRGRRSRCRYICPLGRFSAS